MGKFFPPLALALASILALASDCSRTTTGFTPVTEPGAQSYRGMSLGLYPQGANTRPSAHEAAGLRLAADVRPRNSAGVVDEQNGRIVLISIGMSNTTAEFSVFKPLADADRDKNTRLLIVDGAQGGWSADRIVAGGDPYWQTLADRLRAAGVTAAQVQAAWMKEADPAPTLPFPQDAQRLQSELRTIAQSLRSRFPNLRLLYLSSRIYAGYATSNLNPEPYAYQSGFAVKWLIEQQIQGDAEVSFDQGRAPWMAWGPYLWADGTRARSDGLVWNCSDLNPDDGTHPSVSGQQKVAAMLLDFLKSDSTSRPWFLRVPSPPAPTPNPAALVNAASYQASLAPRVLASLFGAELAGAAVAASSLPLPETLGGVRVEVGGEPSSLLYVSPGQINLVVPLYPGDGSTVVFRNGSASKPLAAQVSIYAPGIFTLDATPAGPAAALHADGRRITPQDPARTGETIMLFLTGLGFRDPRILRLDVLPIVRVGGVTAQVVYSGSAPGFPGLDQINFTLPRDAPLGPAVALVLQLGGATSNSVTLAVGPAS